MGVVNRTIWSGALGHAKRITIKSLNLLAALSVATQTGVRAEHNL
jgi:hypothetical protein